MLVTVARKAGPPWWWKHIDVDGLPCRFEYRPIVFAEGRPTSIVSTRFVSLVAQCVGLLAEATRRRHAYILTFECGWASFIIAAVQTLLRLHRPRHVILQFIMREKTGSLSSRLKYAFMRWCFSSVYLCICSSSRESDYYADTFGWPGSKLAFVPFHGNPDHLTEGHAEEEPFLIAAGRTYRDYRTLFEAVRETGAGLVVVTGSHSTVPEAVPANVTVMRELPQEELSALIRRSMAVVVPLEDRRISIGQSVILEAMAYGKAVIATRVNGTMDYVEHGHTGVLVSPGDVGAMRDAIDQVMRDSQLRRRLGNAARDEVRRRFLPRHYAEAVVTQLVAERV
jgi:glycosyltransferase involved in cell wall biosynthesis